MFDDNVGGLIISWQKATHSASSVIYFQFLIGWVNVCNIAAVFKQGNEPTTTFIKHSTLTKKKLQHKENELVMPVSKMLFKKCENEEFGVCCVVGSPVWKPRDLLGEGGSGGGGGGGGGAAPTTLPRSGRPAPRAHHLSASRKSLAPDHRH